MPQLAISCHSASQELPQFSKDETVPSLWPEANQMSLHTELPLVQKQTCAWFGVVAHFPSSMANVNTEGRADFKSTQGNQEESKEASLFPPAASIDNVCCANA
jgi:hypothetical protein